MCVIMDQPLDFQIPIFICKTSIAMNLVGYLAAQCKAEQCAYDGKEFTLKLYFFLAKILPHSYSTLGMWHFIKA